MQGVVRQRVLRLVVVVGAQQRSCPDAHVVRRQRPAELRRQILRLDELVERVQVVPVEEDLRREGGKETRREGNEEIKQMEEMETMMCRRRRKEI